MPVRQTAPVGAPCWVDLSTSDAARSREFYGALFGWTTSEPQEEFGGYANFLLDGVPVGGCMASQTDGAPEVWTVYLTTDDTQKTLELATAHGGSVIVPAMPVGELGTMAVLADPDGAGVGAWQPGSFPGLQVLAEPGAPSWFELHTRNYDQALSFYREVFHWDTHVMSDEPDFRYTTLGEGEGQLAGVMDATAFLPEGVPSHWSVYFGVEDADAALARVVELGGSVVQPAMDTPYGRLATAADPNGAEFKLVAPNEAMPARS